MLGEVGVVGKRQQLPEPLKSRVGILGDGMPDLVGREALALRRSGREGERTNEEDDAWEEAASKLGGEFVQGTWLANSEIKLSHRDYGIALGVHFGSGSESNNQYTRATPNVSLRSEVKLALYPQMKGFAGAITGGLISSSGKAINLPALSDDFHVLGDDAELANRLFAHHDFVSALRSMPENPTAIVGSSLRKWTDDEAEKDEDDFYVSVPNVVKDIHQLISLIDLTKVLLGQLEENDCLV